MAGLPGEGYAKLLEPIVRWFMSEDGYNQWKHERRGDKLMKAANEARQAWKLNQTPENWKAYEDAKNALAAWSNAP